MKKILICLLALVLLTGCTNINKTDLDTVVNISTKGKHNLINQNNRGFKYYLPREVSVSEYDSSNVLFKNKKYKYYLNVDLISYYHKKDVSFKTDDKAYYTKEFKIKKNKGVINVYKSTKKQKVYLVKISYNYSTIGGYIEEKNLNDSVSNMLLIITSIKYNDDVIKTIVEGDDISSREEPVNVFNIESNDTDILDVEYEDEDENEGNYDRDVIN